MYVQSVFAWQLDFLFLQFILINTPCCVYMYLNFLYNNVEINQVFSWQVIFFNFLVFYLKIVFCTCPFDYYFYLL